MRMIPTIHKYMTTVPYTIDIEQTLAKADQLMKEHEIRHLPVTDGEQLVGVLTDRDIKRIESFRGVNPDKIRVQDALIPHPYITSPEAQLEAVCAQMALHHYGCVLVCDNKKLVGIFTWIDALKAFDSLMHNRMKH